VVAAGGGGGGGGVVGRSSGMIRSLDHFLRSCDGSNLRKPEWQWTDVDSVIRKVTAWRNAINAAKLIVQAPNY
jgi:hypothetical protein